MFVLDQEKTMTLLGVLGLILGSSLRLFLCKLQTDGCIIFASDLKVQQVDTEIFNSAVYLNACGKKGSFDAQGLINFF